MNTSSSHDNGYKSDRLLPDAATDAQKDFSKSMSYGDYLDLDRILAAQHPQGQDPNELLFIIQHQTSELWMKLMLHEMQRAYAAIENDQLPNAFKMSARISRIFEQLISAWDVLATLTPSEYSSIRKGLGQSSGFQSWQYRVIEFVLGNKNAVMLQPHAHRADLHARVEQAYLAPSLYDQVIRLLARRGFAIAPHVLARDVTQAWTFDDSVEAAWVTIYRNPEKHFDLYELAEELMDVEDAFRHWRFRHLSTVSRIIGAKTGTGGTNGAPYLRRQLDVVLFPELWQARTDL